MVRIAGNSAASRAIRVAAFLAYVALVAATAFRHEPGVFEAQGWLIARDASVWETIAVRARHEGNPALWHLALMPLAKLGAPYASASLPSALLGILTAALILFASPFPLPIAVLVPFGHVFAFEFAVIARPYAIASFALVFLAWRYRTRYEAPGTYFAGLALLALSCVHGAFAATALAVLHATTGSRDGIRRSRVAYAAFAGMLAFLAWELWPAVDYVYAVKGGGAHYGRDDFGLGHFVEVALRMPREAIDRRSAWSWLPLAAFAVLFARRRVLGPFLAVAFPVVALGAVKGYQVWHEGLFVLALVFAAWAGEAAGKGRHSLAALWIAFLPLITLHLYFAAQENGRDLTGPFSRAGEVAEALEKTAPRPWYGFGSGVIALNPYFSAPPFANLAASPSYLTWTNPDSFRPNASIAAVEKGTVVWSDITDQEPNAIEASLPADFRRRMRLARAFEAPYLFETNTRAKEVFLLFVPR